MIRIDIDFKQKTATVTTTGAKILTREDAEQVLKAKGYGVTSFTQKELPPKGS